MSPTISHRALLLALAITPASTLAGVYKCLDQNNKVFYQDKPCQELTSAGLSPALSKLAPEENRQHLLWKLEQGERTVFVMASLGFGTADMYPLPESVMDAFASSAVLVVAAELDTADTAALEAKGIYSDGSTLEKHIKPATWQKVVSVAKELNIAEDKFGTLKPWLAALFLRHAKLKQAGYDEKLSVDKTFTKAAGTLKPIVGMGSIEEEITFLNELTDNEQEQLLLQALREAEGGADHFKSQADAWKKGDSNAVELLARATTNALAKSEKSLIEKQQAQTEAIANRVFEMSTDGRRYFVVVDTKHLGGGKGLIALLQNKGFKATQL